MTALDLLAALDRLEKCVNILQLRHRPNGMDPLPQATDVDLAKLILIDGAVVLEEVSK